MTVVADPRQVLKSVQRVKTEMEDPPIFAAVVSRLRLDPAAPVKATIPPAPKRDRHRAGRLTQKVWASLRSDGTVDPTKAVPISAVTTAELPTIKPAGEAVNDASAVQVHPVPLD